MELLPTVGEVTTALKSGGSKIKAGVQKLAGDEAGAKRAVNEVGHGFSRVADGLPVVGHVKGVVHYAMGDTEKGHQSMISASRSTAVLTANLLTGGVGGGIVARKMAGVGSGVAFDGAHSFIDSAVKDERSTHGIWDIDRKLVESRKKNGGLNKPTNAETDANRSVEFDFKAGSSAAKTVTTLDKAETQSQQVAVKDTFSTDAYEPVENAAREMKGNVYVETVVSDEGNVSKGYNQQARGDINIHQLEQFGEETGFGSETVAVTSANANDSDLTKTPQQDVEPVLHQNPTVCIGNDAITKATSKSSNLNVAQLKNCSMKIHDGIVSLVERCENCKTFKMGNVLSVLRVGVRVPLEYMRLYLCKACFTGVAALVSEAAFYEDK